MTTYYTYYSYEEFGRGYIGYRKCPEHLPPETDPYMGSYTDKKFKPTHKIILGTYDNRTEAIADEITLHKAYDVACNLHFANKARQTSVGFSCGTTRLRLKLKCLWHGVVKQDLLILELRCLRHNWVKLILQKHGLKFQKTML